MADIQEELEALQGMKCQAPHSHQWGDTSYHNALVYCTEPCEQVSDMSHIQVRVMFTNPTHREMLPCPYYLEGECKFSNDQCHFSHGELVLLSSLKEYREPDFSVVRPGLRVLVKHSDKLWHRAVVSAVHDKSRCDVKFESNGTRLEVDLHNILPLGDGATEPAETSTSSEDDSEDEPILDPTLIEQSLVNPLSSALGSWEVHTKGVGSRLMARMGYVTGTGLGKHGEGRIEPVEATVLPPGKSLDHCMLLREQAGGDENLFKVERRLKKLHRKQVQQQHKQQDCMKRNTNVFDFINSKLGSKKGNVSQLTNKPQENRSSLKGESCRGLNVVGFQVGEEIRRAERDLAKLEESLSRHSTGSTTHSRIAEKLQDKRGELNQLQASQRSIDQERSIRKDQKKLSVF